MRVAFHQIGFVVAWGMSLAALAGCYNPSTRANERPTAWRQLPPADRQVARSGNVRHGFTRDAVYIAWGAPTRVDTVRLPHRSYERWLYTHTQTGIAGVYFGVPDGFAYPAGRGDDGQNFRAGYYGGTDDVYSATPYVRGFGPPHTEVPYRAAVFADGHLIDYAPH